MIKYSNAIDITSLNHRVRTAPEDLVELSERNYSTQLSQIVRIVSEMEKKPHFMLLAGPSASSKTTTAHKISTQLEKSGIYSRVISLDDFYINRGDLPRLETGEVDYETINTLDLNMLYKCITELIETNRSEFPVFDFSTGCRSEKVNPVTINEHTILILEGLHALNPIITNGFNKDEFLKFYISPTSDYYMGNEKILSAREIRLMRRIIRDHFHRSSSIANTMEMWGNVILAEIDSIMPFERQADFVIDSTIIYEPCVYIENLLDLINNANDIRDIFSEQICALKSSAEKLCQLDKKYIPTDTVLHEFLK